MFHQMNTRELLQVIDASVLVVDQARGVILHANSKARELLRASEEELVGRECRGLQCLCGPGTKAPSDIANLCAPKEVTLMGADGKRLPVLVTASPLKTPRGKLCIITFTDLTPQKEVERKYEAFFTNAVEGVFQSSPDGRFLAVNPALCDILGYGNPEEVIAAFTDLRSQLYADPADRDALLAELQANGQVLSFETRFKRKDGKERWINTSARQVRDQAGNLLYIEGLNVDITERVRSDAALKNAMAEKERLRLNLEAVFRSIPDAIIVVDTKMNVLETNRALDELCCIESEKTRGKPLHLVNGRCKRACFTVLEDTLKTREPVLEYRVECKGHRPGQTVVINSSPLLDSDNNFVGAVLAIRDITRLADLEKRLTDLHSHRGLIGKSKAMRSIYAVLDQLSEVESTVLISGESGTGKELVAEALHYGGQRAKGPLIKVNCSALSENLLESELFGHVRGAFTGAIRDRIGRFEAAEGGTLFLDEIGDISPRIQLNLLRVLERKEYERVGDSRTRRANVRVIAATNVDMAEKIRRGLFREDLYYRLKVMVIHLPPLRCRTEDIPLLCDHFLAQLRANFGKQIAKPGEEIMKVFMTYPWPGNVRELRSALEHACILCPGGEILPEHLPPELARGEGAPRMSLAARPLAPAVQHEPSAGRDLPARFFRRRSLTREDIEEALDRSANNRAFAARLLGIDRRTLYRNMDRFDIR